MRSSGKDLLTRHLLLLEHLCFLLLKVKVFGEEGRFRAEMLSVLELALALLTGLDPRGLPLLGGRMHGGRRCKRKGLIRVRTLVLMGSREAATARQRLNLREEVLLFETSLALLFGQCQISIELAGSVHFFRHWDRDSSSLNRV